MPINFKAYKDIDGEIRFFEEAQTGDGLSAVDVTLERVEGLDNTTSNDGTSSETVPGPHTHTASEITDFGTQVRAEQNNPTLTLSSDTLTLDDGTGTTYTADLSPYIDDTNLSRIDSGSFNSTTNILTLTRNDGTSFQITGFTVTVDTPTFTEVVAEDPGTDITAAEAEELTDGTETTLHSHPLPFFQFAEGVPGASQSTSFVDHTTMTATVEAGTYKLDWYYIWSLNSTSTDIEIQIIQDGSTDFIHRQLQEPKDSAGTGATINRLDTTGTLNTSTDQRQVHGGFDILTFTTSTVTFRLQFRNTTSGTEACLYVGRLALTRVA